MELKLKEVTDANWATGAFNRTAYGIEIKKLLTQHSAILSFNRTAYGIEISHKQLLIAFPPLLIAPLMELK